MKLPFTLGIKFVFRIVLPGFVLALGLLPVSRTALEFGGGGVVSLEYLFILETLVFGWLFVMLDMPIYMLFEGRRYWPGFVRRFFISRERERLDGLERDERVYAARGDRQRVREAGAEARHFPLNAETGRSEATFPTRLGNLLTAFEDYPRRVYGMDSIFYWPRLWVKVDKDLREEIDNVQALADSALYTVAALYACGLLGIAYVFFRLYGVTLVEFLPLRPFDWLLPPSCFVLGYMLYRFSLHTQAQFGELFKTVFDQFRREAQFGEVLGAVAGLTRDRGLLSASVEEQNMAVWRYLHNYRVKCHRCGQVFPPAEAAAHRAPHTRPPADPPPAGGAGT